MTALNLRLFHMDGYAVYGDSLTMEKHRVWRTQGSMMGGVVRDLEESEFPEIDYEAVKSEYEQVKTTDRTREVRRWRRRAAGLPGRGQALASDRSVACSALGALERRSELPECSLLKIAALPDDRDLSFIVFSENHQFSETVSKKPHANLVITPLLNGNYTCEWNAAVRIKHP